jgi:hypothetical protein
VEKTIDARDRRVVHLHLTPSGTQVLDQSIPPDVLKSAINELPEQEQRQMAQSIEHLLLCLQHANGLKTFGTCRTCIHHQQTDDAQRRCGLTREILTDSDANKICREHIPAG